MIKYYLPRENLVKIIKESLYKGINEFDIDMEDEVNRDEVINWIEELGYKAEPISFLGKYQICVSLKK